MLARTEESALVAMLDKAKSAIKIECQVVSDLLISDSTALERLFAKTTPQPFAISVREILIAEKNANIQEVVADLLQAARILIALAYQDDRKKEFFDWCKKNAENQTDSQAEKTCIELLTAIWLCLYFLGVPFWHPCERVLQWAEEDGGGLPNGVCVAKAIGDIIRRGRRIQATGTSAFQVTPPGSNVAALPMIVLSGWPIALFKELVSRTDADECIPNEAHVLGRCYELLQLMLYARCRFPISYFIPEDLVMRNLSIYGASDQKRQDLDNKWSESLEWLRKRVFGEAGRPLQFVYLIKSAHVPPCFINQESGLYTFEQVGDPKARALEIPLPGSYMKEVRRKLYVEMFSTTAPLEPHRNLLSTDSAHSTQMFNEMWSGRNSTAPR